MGTKTILIMMLIFPLYGHSEGKCSKQNAEDKVNDVCTRIYEKGDGVKKEWPLALLFENCGDNYVWVQDTSPQINMVMHPIKRRLDGTSLRGHRDENKVELFVEFDKAAKANAQGAWVDYVWAKPGAEKATAKTSFVKLCKMKNGNAWIAGSGVWKDYLKN